MCPMVDKCTNYEDKSPTCKIFIDLCIFSNRLILRVFISCYVSSPFSIELGVTLNCRVKHRVKYFESLNPTS